MTAALRPTTHPVSQSGGKGSPGVTDNSSLPSKVQVSMKTTTAALEKGKVDVGMRQSQVPT